MMDKRVTTQEILIGRYDLKLDKDRRLTIPDEWMPYFGESGRVVAVPDPHERCIDIVPADLMEKELDRLRREAKRDAGLNDTLRVIGSAAEQLVLDRNSIRISDKLLEYAGIEDQVALLGAVRAIQVWNPDALGPDEPFDVELDYMKDETKEVDPKEIARERIGQLLDELKDRPDDVALLTELLGQYRIVGDEANLEAIMRRLMDIPSKADVRAMAREFVTAVSACAEVGVADVDALRRSYGPVFAIVERCDEVRPRVLMDAMECGCSFAVTVLQTFCRLGVVSEDREFGLRGVTHPSVTGRVTLRPRVEEDDSKVDALIDKVKSHPGWESQISVSWLQRTLGVSYNRACLLMERIRD